MMHTRCHLGRLLLEASIAETSLAQRCLARWEGAAPEIIADVAPVIERAKQQVTALSSGKRTLLITRRKGPFLTTCQGMTQRHRACCNYRILNVFQNCPMDCSYCILQHYLDNPLLVLNANIEGLRDEIERARHANGRRLLRIGTGELGDSLALDRLTGLSLDLMRAVEPFDDVVLELKTKTVEIENLLSVAAPRNVIVSWSLNTPRHIANEEIGAPSLDDRLDAARRCIAHGYRVGFHFDPLIHTPTWEEDYRPVVEALWNQIDAARVVWISLGALRYPPGMKRIIAERFPRSTITGGELIPSWDGKMRYFRPIRVAMYRQMAQWIGSRAAGVPIYLCMESPEIWQEVLGHAPRGVAEVAEMLDAGCRKTERVGSAVRVAD